MPTFDTNVACKPILNRLHEKNVLLSQHQSIHLSVCPTILLTVNFSYFNAYTLHLSSLYHSTSLSLLLSPYFSS